MKKIQELISIFLIFIFVSYSYGRKFQKKEYPTQFKNIRPLNIVEPSYSNYISPNHQTGPIANYPRRDTEWYSSLIDSSMNGYGAYTHNPNPIASSLNNGYVIAYRKFEGFNQSAGYLGSAKSSDAISWNITGNINDRYPTGEETPNLPTASGTPQARYPSAGFSPGGQPTVVWNEYTNSDHGGGSYGGYPLYAYDVFGVDQGNLDFVNPFHVNNGCVTTPCNPPDLWSGNVFLGLQNNSPKFYSLYDGWSDSPNKFYWISSNFHANGYFLLNDPIVLTDDSEILGNGSALWYDNGNYTSAPSYHINDSGIGYVGLTSFASTYGVQEPRLHTFWYKNTNDYGDNWSSQDGYENSGYNYINDQTLVRITDSLFTLFSENPEDYPEQLWYPWAECDSLNSFGEVITYACGDTLFDSNGTEYFLTPGLWFDYNFDLRTDYSGGMHVVASCAPLLCKDLNGGCEDNNGDGLADSIETDHFFNAGHYYFYNPNPISEPNNWRLSLINDMSETYSADWQNSDIPYINSLNGFGAWYYFYPQISIGGEPGSQTLWYATSEGSSFSYDANDEYYLPQDIDIFVRKSQDLGQSWSELENVTNTNTGLPFPDKHLEVSVHLPQFSYEDKLGLFYTIPDLYTETYPPATGYEDYLNRIYVGIVGGVQTPVDEILTLDSFDEGLSENYGYTYDFNNSEGYLAPVASDFENAQCVKIDYSVHNSESWGGYVQVQRNAPDEFWDWSQYNTISFNYFNSIPPDQIDRVEFRLILDDIDDSGFYSFHKILDDVSNQWEKVEIPLINNGSWNGHGFNYTGWLGTEGDQIIDLSQIRNYKLEFSINTDGESGDYQSGTIYLDELQLENTIPRYPVTFQFDARNLEVSPNGIHLAGGFDYEYSNPEYPNWDPAGIMLDDSDGNGFYSVTLQLTAGDYQYKFINGNTWEDQHDQIYEELSCTFNDGSGYYNRSVSVNSDIVLAPVCLNLCEPCDLQFFTIENVSVVHGDTALVEVSMEFSNPSFNSIDLSFSGFQDKLVFNDIVTEGYMFGDAQWITVVNNTETLLITASAGATLITDNGVLFALELVVPEALSTQIVPVVIEDFSGNEDLDEAIFIDGGVEVVWEPLAGFASDTTNGYLPLTINFTDTSEIGTYPIVDWQWNFGDGTLVSGSETEHTYLEEGNYTVTLIVTDEFGLSDTLEMVDYITAIFPVHPTAGFAVSTTSGDYPLDILFTDTSNMGTYPIVDWSWDFGNDSTGVGSEVSATYERPGEFDVTLMVMDEYGLSDTLILTDFVQVDTTFGDLDWNTNVQSFDASFILKHLAEMIELDELQLQVADVTQDETISPLDATVILQHVVGLVEDLPFTPDESYSATGDLAMSNQGADPGMQIEVPINISNGSNIYGFTGNLVYDPLVVSIDTVLFSDYLDGYLFELNEINSGEIRIASAGELPDGETGVFATLIVTVGENFTEETNITITDLRWNEDDVSDAPIEMTISFGLGVDVASIPDVFELHQNYPNPFNPTTQIKYDLPEDALVSITIYDVMGRSIRTLMNVYQRAGYHSTHWDAKNNMGEGISAGMYIYTIQAGEFRATKKMVLLK